MSEEPTPQRKDRQDQKFGQTVADKQEAAERMAAEGRTPDESDERAVEHHAGGKA